MNQSGGKEVTAFNHRLDFTVAYYGSDGYVDIQLSAITLKPTTGEGNNINSLVAMQCSAEQSGSGLHADVAEP